MPRRAVQPVARCPPGAGRCSSGRTRSGSRAGDSHAEVALPSGGRAPRRPVLPLPASPPRSPASGGCCQCRRPRSLPRPAATAPGPCRSQARASARARSLRIRAAWADHQRIRRIRHRSTGQCGPSRQAGCPSFSLTLEHGSLAASYTGSCGSHCRGVGAAERTMPRSAPPRQSGSTVACHRRASCYDSHMAQEPAIRITRSPNRSKTISARLVEGGAVIEVLAPSSATDAELGADHRPPQGAHLAPPGEGRDCRRRRTRPPGSRAKPRILRGQASPGRGALRDQPANALWQLHPLDRRHPHLTPGRRHAGVGARLRARSRARAPEGAESRLEVLEASQPLSEDRARTRLPDRRRPRGGRRRRRRNGHRVNGHQSLYL